MQIVSYRGPCQKGGVAALIRPVMAYEPACAWWHLVDGCLQTLCGSSSKRRALIPASIIEGHYRYCNEFLWPLMHGRSELTRYTEADHSAYRSLNMVVAAHLDLYGGDERSWIHDYQFALLASYLPVRKSSNSVFFWHIPWPSTFVQGFELHLMEIARGLLRCGTVGFHIEDYVKNFCTFVREFLPEYRVLSDDTAILDGSGRRVDLIASPAGIDSASWQEAARAARGDRPLPGSYILSVDRADYTKGIAERTLAIQNLFRSHPGLRGKLQFVFACQQTRCGLEAFDQYWTQCRASYRNVNAELGLEDWSPIVWLTQSMAPPELARWYAHASAMLVNPSIDGLNLTAKEFVASTTVPDSVLILSQGAGVWRELGGNTITVKRCRPDEITEAIKRALKLPVMLRRANINALKATVGRNSLERWWRSLIYSKSSVNSEVFDIRTPA